MLVDDRCRPTRIAPEKRADGGCGLDEQLRTCGVTTIARSDALASGNLKPSEATELVRLSPRGQDTMFHAIRTGGCRNDGGLRASSTALVNA
jgi:hypothetical protein